MVYKLGTLLKISFINCDVIKTKFKTNFDMLLEVSLNQDPNERVSLDDFLYFLDSFF